MIPSRSRRALSIPQIMFYPRLSLSKEKLQALRKMQGGKSATSGVHTSSVLHSYFSGTSLVLQWYFTCTSVVLQSYFTGTSRYFSRTSPVLQSTSSILQRSSYVLHDTSTLVCFNFAHYHGIHLVCVDMKLLPVLVCNGFNKSSSFASTPLNSLLI